MSNEAQEKICADKKTINVENQYREEQIRMNFEKEFEKKEKRLKKGSILGIGMGRYMGSNIGMYKVAYGTSKNFDLTHSPDLWGWVNMSDIESVHTCISIFFY